MNPVADPDAAVIVATRAWVEKVVIGLGLCPFAGQAFAEDAIRYLVDHASAAEPRLHQLIGACRELDRVPSVETTLLIYPRNLEDFNAFLDFHALADALLAAQGYEGVYQLASFHPLYQFADAPEDDPANYTNRSPFPMLHLLREEGLSRAVEGYGDAEGIPQRNIAHTRRLGLEAMRALLASCKTP